MRSCPFCNHEKAHTKYQVDSYQIVKCHKRDFVFLANPPSIENEEQNYEQYFLSSVHSDYSQSSQRQQKTLNIGSERRQ